MVRNFKNTLKVEARVWVVFTPKDRVPYNHLHCHTYIYVSKICTSAICPFLVSVKIVGSGTPGDEIIVGSYAVVNLTSQISEREHTVFPRIVTTISECQAWSRSSECCSRWYCCWCGWGVTCSSCLTDLLNLWLWWIRISTFTIYA